MTKIGERYWTEADSSLPNKYDTSSGIKGTSYPNIQAPHKQNPNSPSFSRFEIFPHTQTFFGKPDPLYSTQFSDLFVPYLVLNMQTGQPNPQSMINENISGKVVLDTTAQKCFSSINSI